MGNDAAKSIILELVNEILGNGVLTKNNYKDNLGEYGLDSLTMIMLVSELERRFQCVIPDSKMEYSKMNTMEKIYNLVEEVLAGEQETLTKRKI